MILQILQRDGDSPFELRIVALTPGGGIELDLDIRRGRRRRGCPTLVVGGWVSGLLILEGKSRTRVKTKSKDEEPTLCLRRKG
jgi:hypothetical protein